MPEWIDIPNFVDGDIIRAATFQDIWANLEALHTGEHDIQHMPGNAFDFWSTSNADFTIVDADYYRITIETYGGDLLIIANMEVSHTTGRGNFTLFIDGASVGNDNGLYSRGSGDIFEAVPLVYVATGLDAGTHLIVVMHNDNGGGTSKVFKKSCMNLSVMELN